MITAAQTAVKGKGDGRISAADVALLSKAVRPGGKGTATYDATEKATMLYIRTKYKFTAEGDKAMRHFISVKGGQQAARTVAMKAVMKAKTTLAAMKK